MYQNKHCTQNCRKDKYKTVKGYYGNSQVWVGGAISY